MQLLSFYFVLFARPLDWVSDTKKAGDHCCGVLCSFVLKSAIHVIIDFNIIINMPKHRTKLEDTDGPCEKKVPE